MVTQSTDLVELPSDRLPRTPAEFISQATAVEQARAVAEVQAAVLVAQQVPRDLTRAVTDMRQSCSQIGLADRAFYRYPRGGQTVTGESIHLARELARCWGNCDYGIKELRRDDENHYSEMQAWAWDQQTNTRSSQSFIVPHKRDTKKGVQAMVDLRDIYENNANMGARRLREAIFAILPKWYTEDAKTACLAALETGGGDKPLEQRVADAVKTFEALGVKRARLEARFGPTADWSAHDLAQLRVIHGSVKQGTVTAEDEFPSRTTADDIPTSDTQPQQQLHGTEES
jgi:hypothetical protein